MHGHALLVEQENGVTLDLPTALRQYRLMLGETKEQSAPRQVPADAQIAHSYRHILAQDSSTPSPAAVQHRKSSILAVISALLCFPGVFAPTAPAASYTTDFPKAEPLISEGGRWITAGTPGVRWQATLCGFKGDQHISGVSNKESPIARFILALTTKVIEFMKRSSLANDAPAQLAWIFA